MSRYEAKMHHAIIKGEKILRNKREKQFKHLNTLIGQSVLPYK